MRSPGEPGYDPNTLYIPKHYFEKVFTPFEKQYWLVKQDFWDTILFFKKVWLEQCGISQRISSSDGFAWLIISSSSLFKSRASSMSSTRRFADQTLKLMVVYMRRPNILHAFPRTQTLVRSCLTCA